MRTPAVSNRRGQGTVYVGVMNVRCSGNEVGCQGVVSGNPTTCYTVTEVGGSFRYGASFAQEGSSTVTCLAPAETPIGVNRVGNCTSGVHAASSSSRWIAAGVGLLLAAWSIRAVAPLAR